MTRTIRICNTTYRETKLKGGKYFYKRIAVDTPHPWPGMLGQGWVQKGQLKGDVHVKVEEISMDHDTKISA